VALDDGGEGVVKTPGILLPALLVFIGTPAAAAGPSEDDFRFRFDLVRLDLASIYHSNIDHDVPGQEDYGVEIGAYVRLQSHERRPALWLQYRGAVQTYAVTDDWDRLKHRIETGLGLNFSRPARFELTGELNTRTSTEDREIVNQFTVSPELFLVGEGYKRLRPYGAFRYKDFTEAIGRDETIWYAGVRGRTGLWPSAWIELGYRYEDAESQAPEESYLRHRLSLEIGQVFGRWDRLSAGLQYRIRNYPEDFVDDADQVARRDKRWIPAVRWTHRLRRGQQLLLDYEFQTRSSNDPDKIYDAHRISLALRWPFIR
jgi:hypothetical protein